MARPIEDVESRAEESRSFESLDGNGSPNVVIEHHNGTRTITEPFEEIRVVDETEGRIRVFWEDESHGVYGEYDEFHLATIVGVHP